MRLAAERSPRWTCWATGERWRASTRCAAPRAKLDRTLVGPYARIGFGKWGIFAEHDITTRTLLSGRVHVFRQDASYGQIFWAVKEWLVPAITGERLTVERLYREAWIAGGVQIGARLTPQFTFQLSTRIQHNQLTGVLRPR